MKQPNQNRKNKGVRSNLMQPKSSCMPKFKMNERKKKPLKMLTQNKKTTTINIKASTTYTYTVDENDEENEKKKKTTHNNNV